MQKHYFDAYSDTTTLSANLVARKPQFISSRTRTGTKTVAPPG